MKKTKRSLSKIVGFFFILPLLMSNSPLPYPTYEKYSSFESNLVSVIGNAYTFNIINEGNSKALLFTGNLNSLNNEYINYEKIEGLLFDNEMFLPNEEKTITIHLENPSYYNITETGNKFVGSIFTVLDENIQPKNFSVSRVNDNTYLLNGDFGDLSHYYYEGVVDLTYEGKEYSIHIDLDGKRQFKTSKELDLSKLTINKVSAYRSNYNRYEGGKILKIIGIVFLVCIAIDIFIIPPSIIIPVSIVKYRRRKRKQIGN